MAEEKYLSVMDLAARVGVPRTTINDWLTKYSIFITSIPQGKRKVYPENTIEILKEIGELRSSGLSFQEIEKHLAKAHFVHPVPANEELPFPEEKGEEKEEENSCGKTGEEKENPSETTSLQVVPATKDDFAHLVENMAFLSSRLMEEEKKRSKVFHLAFVAFLLVFLAFSFVSFLFYKNFQTLAKNNQILEKKNEETSQRLLETEKNALSLQKANSDFRLNMAKLDKELIQQRKTFDSAIKRSLEANKEALKRERKWREKLLSEKEARLALEREKFTAARLELLKKLDQEKKHSRNLMQEKKILAEELQRNRKKLLLEKQKKSEQKISPAVKKIPEEKKVVEKKTPPENKKTPENKKVPESKK